MSVINKMLRDLDASARPRDGQGRAAHFADGTISVGAPAAAPRRSGNAARRWIMAVGGAVLLSGAGAFAWWVWSNTPARPPVSAPAALPVSAPPPEPVPAPTAVPAPVAPAPQPVTVAPAVVRTVSAPAPAARPAAPEVAPKAEVRLAAAPAAASAPVAAVRPVQPADIVDDAQKLWDRGERQAAMQMLRERVDSPQAVALAGSAGALWLWTSELTRMEVASGQSAEALQRLVRLEPQLSGQAAAWATRGNIAQRLGRHAESAQAYLNALALRPDEPRWMLGAAVSLAADGRAAQASDWARRAQSRGVVNPEIAAFLRQQGVNF